MEQSHSLGLPKRLPVSGDKAIFEPHHQELPVSFYQGLRRFASDQPNGASCLRVDNTILHYVVARDSTIRIIGNKGVTIFGQDGIDPYVIKYQQGIPLATRERLIVYHQNSDLAGFYETVGIELAGASKSQALAKGQEYLKSKVFGE
jgi:hypothetical protein